MTDKAPALAMRGVRKTFEAENAPVRALRGVDLHVDGGEFVALMGPSGCGKSTLLNLVAGLDTPDEGEISVAGKQVTGCGDDDLARLRRQHIGLVFQFFNLLEGMTVLENVTLPAVIAGQRRRMAETRARDLLDLLGISDKAGALPGVLSGGQRQRLATRAGAGQQAHAAARGRAHRGTGLRGRGGDHRTAAAAAPRRPDHRHGDPRRQRRRGGRAPGADARRADRAPRGPSGQRRPDRHGGPVSMRTAVSSQKGTLQCQPGRP